MIWIGLALAMALGALVVGWLWTIPLVATLAISPGVTSVPAGTRLEIASVGLGGRAYRVVVTTPMPAGGTTIAIQPKHPWSWPWP